MHLATSSSLLALDKVGPKTWFKRAEQIRDLKESDRLVATVIYLHTTRLLKASTAHREKRTGSVQQEDQPIPGNQARIVPLFNLLLCLFALNENANLGTLLPE
jgi:hypothetical protein